MAMVMRNALVRHRAIALVMAWCLLLFGALYAGQIHNQDEFNNRFVRIERAQRHEAHMEQVKLCGDLNRMALIAPPGGTPVGNPSRAFEQAEHETWESLATGYDCHP